MKAKITLLSLATALTLASCGGEQATEVVTAPAVVVVQDTTPAMVVDTFKIASEASEVKWVGTKLVGASHNGYIKFKEGWLGLSEGKLVSGDFTIDLSSIVDLDIKKASDNSRLVDHLKSADFFNVDSFPTAHFLVSSATDSTVTGNLTLRNITNSVTLPFDVKMMGDSDMIVLSKKFSINRTKWGIMHATGSIAGIAKDKIISDMIELEISLNARK